MLTTGPKPVVLVTGPARSGVSSLVAVLRERMPELAVGEPDHLGSHRPAAVVVVVSAIAPMTESDCRHVDVVSARADVVIGVVSKVDAHRGWRDVLDANRADVRARASRMRAAPWVAVAAAPDAGLPDVDELVAALRAGLVGHADSKPLCRNNSRSRHGSSARWHADRVALTRQHRRARSERALALRGGLAQLRAALGALLRRRSNELRADFRARAAELPRADVGRLRAELLAEVDVLLAELDTRMHASVGELADRLGVTAPAGPRLGGGPQLPAPPAALKSGERRLTMVLGAGFGLGVAMAVSRMLGALAPELVVPGLVVGGLSGLALTVWLVTTRALLAERASIDRWVSDVLATVRLHGEEVVIGGLVAAELGLAAELAKLEEAESVALTRRQADLWGASSPRKNGGF